MAEDDKELPEEVYQSVTDLSEQGNLLLDSGDQQSAVDVWEKALSILPKPIGRWEAATWLYASIGDGKRQTHDMNGALDAFRSAHNSADGAMNPFVQLGIGTCLYDLKRIEESTDPLLRAYMMEGEEIFAQSDPKYLDHLKTRKLID